MNQPPAFWDSSALIPLCILQPQTASARALNPKHQIVAWWATEVEILSGLTRLQRMAEITRTQFNAGKRLARVLIGDWMAVHESTSITSDACALLETYPLRAADALQLAAALEACDRKPQGYVFITADQRLADAARDTGFTVEYL
jgi:uncharacterized protein